MTFQRDIAISEIATKKVFKIFEKNGLEPNIVNEKGYDMIIKDGLKVEIKFDTWIVQRKTGNLSCEWWSNENNKTEGWLNIRMQIF